MQDLKSYTLFHYYAGFKIIYTTIMQDLIFLNGLTHFLQWQSQNKLKTHINYSDLNP